MVDLIKFITCLTGEHDWHIQHNFKFTDCILTEQSKIKRCRKCNRSIVTSVNPTQDFKPTILDKLINYYKALRRQAAIRPKHYEGLNLR